MKCDVCNQRVALHKGAFKDGTNSYLPRTEEMLEIAVEALKYAVGPTRDVKAPVIIEALAKIKQLENM